MSVVRLVRSCLAARASWVGLIVAALVAGMWGGAVASPAGADTVPAAGVLPTVSADPLPTVQVNGVVWSQVTVGNTVYATGSFTSARPAGSPAGTNETPRSNLIAYDIRTGAMIASFNHSLNAEGDVVTASPDGSRIYVGGSFTSVDGQPRYRIAAFDTATGALDTAFHPTMDASVHALTATNSTVYAGGSFSNVNGTTRTRLAAVAASNGAVLGWNASADTTVKALILTPDGSKLVIGGQFAKIDGVSEPGFGAVSASTGGLVPWATNGATYPIQDSGTNAGIYSFATDGVNLYGTAWQFSGGNFEGRWEFSPVNGSIVWMNDCHGDTYDSVPLNGVLYSVGHAHDCSGMGLWPQLGTDPFHRALAETTVTSGQKNVGPDAYGWNYSAYDHSTQLDWYPNLTIGTYTGQQQAAWSVTGNGSYLALGGEFPSVNGVAQQGLVRYAVKALAPNKMGPTYQPTSLNPTVTATGATVTVNWTADWDPDNQNLTYAVLRDGVQAGTVASPSTFWQLPALSYTDSNVPAGNHTYRIVAMDPFGNTMPDVTDATVTIAGTTTGGGGGTPIAGGATLKTSNGLCVAASNPASSSAPLVLATCDGSAGQAWKVTVGGTAMLSVPGNSNACMAAGATSAGSAVQFAGCNGGSLQSWSYLASGAFMLISGRNCVAPRGGSSTVGTALILAACDGAADQKFILPAATGIAR